MNESLALDGVGSLSMETSRLYSITQRWNAGILAGDRIYIRNETALGVLLGGLCFGVLGLILFMLAVCCKIINTRHLTVFKVSLIVISLLQSVSTPAVVMNLVGSTCSVKYCYKLLTLWLASRRCGVLLHLLVALEFFLIWIWREGTKILPLYWSLPVVLTLDVICILFLEVIEAAVALGAVATTLTLVILIQAGCFSRCTEKRSYKVVCAALLTFGVTYCPSFVVECMIINNEPISGWIYDIFLCLTNLHLVMDGYLCWVTCRETPEEASQQVEARQVDLDSVIQVRV